MGLIRTLRVVFWALSKFCHCGIPLLRLLYCVAFSWQQPDPSELSMKWELVCEVNKKVWFWHIRWHLKRFQKIVNSAKKMRFWLSLMNAQALRMVPAGRNSAGWLAIEVEVSAHGEGGSSGQLLPWLWFGASSKPPCAAARISSPGSFLLLIKCWKGFQNKLKILYGSNHKSPTIGLFECQSMHLRADCKCHGIRQRGWECPATAQPSLAQGRKYCLSGRRCIFKVF